MRLEHNKRFGRLIKEHRRARRLALLVGLRLGAHFLFHVMHPPPHLSSHAVLTRARTRDADGIGVRGRMEPGAMKHELDFAMFDTTAALYGFRCSTRPRPATHPALYSQNDKRHTREIARDAPAGGGARTDRAV